MEDQQFRELFQQIIDQYKLDPITAKELLQRILKALPPGSLNEESP